MKNKKLNILYLFVYGDLRNNKTIKDNKYISDGGSNIHINFILRILKKINKINIVTFKKNYQAEAFFIDQPKIYLENFNTLSSIFDKNLIRFETLTRCIYPSFLYLFKKRNQDYLFTATDFLVDTLAGFFTKIRNPKIKWIASFFLKAPFPFFNKNNPYKGKRWIISFFYWLQQIPSYFLIKYFADTILVTSQPDQNLFITNKRDKSNILIVQGGVDTTQSKKYLKINQSSLKSKKYDAVFMGRFHYQKGLLELIDIWQLVVSKNNSAKLVLIGDGPLKLDVQKKIIEYNLVDNIKLIGVKTGSSKYRIFKQSKIVVHPATYDSGGMSAAEAMAWGLPGVSFDLESLKTYYPQGMIKTKCFSNKIFAQNILKLLTNQSLYESKRKEAINLINNVWDWDKRTDFIYNRIFNS